MNTWWRGIYISMFNTQQRHFDNVNYTSLWSFQLNKTSKLIPPLTMTLSHNPWAAYPLYPGILVTRGDPPKGLIYLVYNR